MTPATSHLPASPTVAGETTAPFRLQQPQLPVAAEMFRQRRITSRDGRPLPLDVFIPQQQAQLLYSLVRGLRPRATLEIGLANGISALFIAQALRDNGTGRHVAIDPYQSSEWGQAGMVALERAGLANWVTLREALSHQVLPELERDGLRIQFAFVDGSHLFDYVMADFLNVDRLLDVGGLIAFDDSDWPAIEAVLRFALANRHYEVYPTGVIIEPSRFRPTLPARLLRAAGRRLRCLRTRLRQDFLRPSHELGIRGRCVVLRKTAEDDRDNQARTFVPFV